MLLYRVLNVVHLEFSCSRTFDALDRLLPLPLPLSPPWVFGTCLRCQLLRHLVGLSNTADNGGEGRAASRHVRPVASGDGCAALRASFPNSPIQVTPFHNSPAQGLFLTPFTLRSDRCLKTLPIVSCWGCSDRWWLMSRKISLVGRFRHSIRILTWILLPPDPCICIL